MAGDKGASRALCGVAGLVLAAAVLLFVMPAPPGIGPRVLPGAGVVLFAVGLFATRAVPEPITALAYFLIAMLLSVAPAGIVFAGFESAAFWLVFTGLIIGIGVRRTGLGEHLARAITGGGGQSYAGIIIGVVLLSIAMAFAMPSTTGRMVILTPIMAGLADRLGFKIGSNGRAGLIMAMAFGTWMPSAAILPSHVPNMVLAGAAESLYDLTLTYGAYLLLHFPVLGVAKAALIVATVLVLFPDRPRPTAATAPAAPLSPEARHMGAVLAVTLALWMTDFLHGISPAWISLGAAVYCLLPQTRLLPATGLDREIDFGTVIYVAGIIGLGPMVVDTGLGEVLGRYLADVLPLSPGADLGNFISLVGLAMISAVATTVPAVPSVLAPFAADLARATDLSVYAVLMTQVVGYSTVLFPYQVPPLIIACTLGGVSIGAAARLTLAMTALSLVLIVPLSYLWWRLLGVFG